MRPSFFLLLGLCALGLLSAGCASKALRTICIEGSADCDCATMVTATTRTVACSVAAHPGWSCCQEMHSSECSCRPAGCAPTLMTVDDCATASAAYAAANPLVSTPPDGGGDTSP